jgi:hypothetical protein
MANPGFSAASPRGWDHLGNLTPKVEYSESVRPHAEWKPADYLPVQRFEKKMEVYFVVSAGKIVACDRAGRVVPAGLKETLAQTSGTVLTYTQADVDEKVIDLGTSAAVTAAKTYTRAQLDVAMTALGLIGASEAPEDYIGNPIGVAPYNYLKWAGGDGSNPAEQVNLNFSMQHQVAILCDYVVEMPVVPAEEVTEALTTGGDWSTSASKHTYTFKKVPMAQPTFLNPLTLSASTRFLKEKAAEADLSAEGDYFVNVADSKLVLYSSALTAATLGSATYYNYASAPASVGTYACAKGHLRCGDYVKHDLDSNYVKADMVLAGTSQAEIQAALDERDKVIGQVLEVEGHPKDYLDRVRTAYTQLGTLDRMPGTATQGLPDNVTYSGASNLVVRINLIRK